MLIGGEAYGRAEAGDHTGSRQSDQILPPDAVHQPGGSGSQGRSESGIFGAGGAGIEMPHH